ncbi:MAG: hypothetical protein AAGH64_03455 [Planctomycetota bacterium]
MSRSLRRVRCAMVGAICVACATGGCSRHALERAMVEHDHVVLDAQEPFDLADVPLD